MAPYILGRIEHQYAERPHLYTAAPRRPTEYFKRFYYDTVTESVPALRLARELFGSDHIVYGTDFPFWDTAERIARDVEALGLPEAEQEAIFSGNARRILPRLR
jgi:aminocarboxymuconate-semialdehyde decarboxylase